MNSLTLTGTEPIKILEEGLRGAHKNKIQYLIHLSMFGSHRRAAQYAEISETSSARWRKDPEFNRLVEVAKSLRPEELISLLFRDVLPGVLMQVIDIALKPWEECRPWMERPKRWAMDIILAATGIVGKERIVVNQNMDFRSIVEVLREAEELKARQTVEGHIVREQ